MEKKFNATGSCFPEKHYMVKVDNKIREVFSLVEEEYFTINRPRQYGKTTILALLEDFLKKEKDFFPINISFEGLGKDSYENEKVFIEDFLLQLETTLMYPFLVSKLCKIMDEDLPQGVVSLG